MTDDWQGDYGREQPREQPREPLPLFASSSGTRVKVYREDPAYPPHVVGWYRDYDEQELDRIEATVGKDFGSGGYLVRVYKEGQLSHQGRVRISAGPARDSQGKEIVSEERERDQSPSHPRFARDPVNHRIGPEGWNIGDPHAHAFSRSSRDLEHTRVELDDLRLKLEAERDQATVLKVELGGLRAKLERAEDAEKRESKASAEKIADLREERAELRRKIEMLEEKVQPQRDESAELLKTILPALLQREPQQGMTPQDAVALAKDLSGLAAAGGGGGIMGELASGVAAIQQIAALQQTSAPQAPAARQPAQQRQVAGPPAPQTAAPASSRPAAPPVIYANRPFAERCLSGLRTKPDVREWAVDVLRFLTAEGRDAIAGVQDAASLKSWISRVPGVDVAALTVGLAKDSAGQMWLLAAIDALKEAAHA